jgi:hypothetical protein
MALNSPKRLQKHQKLFIFNEVIKFAFYIKLYQKFGDTEYLTRPNSCNILIDQ